MQHCRADEVVNEYTMLKLIFLLIVGSLGQSWALENGLARTPPMGWLSWTRFMCQTDCAKYPKHCINENLFTEMADVMVKEGYRDAGYDLVNLDDCWMAKQRDGRGRLQSDPQRFPSGIKWLSQYMHNQGLRLGIYENYGEFTCMGFPGSQDHMKVDAETFISWDVDMLKFDGCFNDPLKMDAAYPEMGSYLGKPVVYSCSWPYYIRKELRNEPDYESISKHCNMWRNYDDIQIHWKSVESIINFYDKHQDVLSKFHGPGHWNDPDMIIVGNPGLTADQCRAQMAIWAVWSAPLLMSNDLRDMKPEFKEILLNRKVIAINQDPLGIMGKKIKEFSNGKVSLYKKKLASPSQGSQLESYAVVFLNKDEYQVKVVKLTLASIGLKAPSGYSLDDVFAVDSPHRSLSSAKRHEADELLEVAVPPTGVVMWRLDGADWAVGADDVAADEQSWLPPWRQLGWAYALSGVLLVAWLVGRRSRWRRVRLF